MLSFEQHDLINESDDLILDLFVACHGSVLLICSIIGLIKHRSSLAVDDVVKDVVVDDLTVLDAQHVTTECHWAIAAVVGIVEGHV